MKNRYTSLLVALFVLAFMYLPIVALVAQSFNASRFGGPWKGFSLKWYEALFKDQSVIDASINTLIIALVATVISTILGTLAAWVLNKYKGKFQNFHYSFLSSKIWNKSPL